MTREHWLSEMVKLLAEDFAMIGQPIKVDLVRVSVGFPSKRAMSMKHRAIGECWSPKVSASGLHEIFVSPLLGKGIEAAATLTHELVHSAVGTDKGHKGPFKKAALAIGLEGKMTATVAGKKLTERLNGLIDKVGEYPHSAISPHRGRKKEGTRLLKASCDGCGYTIRVTRKWADEGLPTCICGQIMELENDAKALLALWRMWALAGA